MSNKDDGLNIKFRMPVPFDAQYIKGFLAGNIGDVYVTVSPDNQIIKAEAEFVHSDAPFKRLLIDDPKILRIFGANGKAISMTAIPRPYFTVIPALDANDEGFDDFEVGRLVFEGTRRRSPPTRVNLLGQKVPLKNIRPEEKKARVEKVVVKKTRKKSRRDRAGRFSSYDTPAAISSKPGVEGTGKRGATEGEYGREDTLQMDAS
jgi:hypothetical protein